MQEKSVMIMHPVSYTPHEKHFKMSTKEAKLSRTIAEPVSHWRPTAAARVQSWVWQVGFVVDKVALGQVFSE
jgi:hypothetical protein